MTTYVIEDIHDIDVITTKYEAKIDFKGIQGATSRLEMSLKDAEFLLERLAEALKKN